MNQRQKHTLIAVVVALLGIVLILSVVWIVGREHRFSHYYSKKYNFSIGYPALWELRENTDGVAVHFLSPLENDLDFFRENVSVIVQDLTGIPEGLSDYTTFAIEELEMTFGDNLVILESDPITISGEPGHKLIFLGKGPDTEVKIMSTWMIKDLTAYQITYTALSSEKYDRYKLAMKRMLRSFRLE